MKTRTAAATAITLAALLTITGCSMGTNTEWGSGPMPASPHATSVANMSDVMFTTMMIPHHEQAVEMADMILAKEGIDDRVTALAEQIKAAQGPEIQIMRDWLEAWNADTAAGMGGMNHGDGMMTGTDMENLDTATGTEASRLFLEQMIQHHEGAIEMAQVEVDSGQNRDVVDLAQLIVDAQAAEISTMRNILSAL